MFFNKLQNRLIFAFILIVLVILIISGWLLQWSVRQRLETELGRKLTAVAGSASVMFDEEDIAILESGVGGRAVEYYRGRLLQLKKAAMVRRIYLFDLAQRNLMDTDTLNAPGDIIFGLRFYLREMESVEAGQGSHSVLFQAAGGRPFMTGFSPLFIQGRVAGGAAVEGSADFLGAVASLQKRLIVIGLISTALAVVLGIVLARTVTRPVRRLAEASRLIGRGANEIPVPVQGRGEVAALANAMETMRKGIVEREQRLKAMLAGIAHEIRNPLGGMELFLDLLRDECRDNTAATDQVGRIQNELSYLKDIVNQFIEYAKPRQPQAQAVDPAALLKEVSDILDEALKEKNIRFEWPCAEDSIHVFVDPGHLKQVLLNVMRNGIEAAGTDGNIRIEIGKRDACVLIAVTNSGQAVPGNIRGRLFDPFFTTREKGTGLGLSIARNLIEINGGTIRLAKTGENGTTFEIELPAS